jgi:predicted metal-dependent hydrolase
LLQLPLWDDSADDAHWRVRRSARARRLSVRVFRDGAVEVVVPQRANPAQIATFVTRHRAWIERQQQRVAPVDTAFPPTGIELRAVGEHWQVRGAAGQSLRRLSPAVSELQAGALPGNGILELQHGAEPGALRAGLMDWLARRAAALLEPQLQALALTMGSGYRRMQIRRQRTRWGSCSTRGTISLNCCLLFQRPPVVRYLLVHELAHLAHMNHSARFWAHVARFEPQWRELDAELAQGWSQVPGWALTALRT